MKALHGYEIHPNGYVTTSLPRKEIGINRLRFLCGKCTTSVLFFPRKDFNEFTQSVVKQIEEKAKARKLVLYLFIAKVVKAYFFSTGF